MRVVFELPDGWDVEVKQLAAVPALGAGRVMLVSVVPAKVPLLLGGYPHGTYTAGGHQCDWLTGAIDPDVVVQSRTDEAFQGHGTGI